MSHISIKNGARYGKFIQSCFNLQINGPFPLRDSPAENGSCIHHLGLDTVLMIKTTMIPCRRVSEEIGHR